VLALFVGACGDDDSESEPATGGGGEAAANPVVESAQKELDGARGPLTFEPPGPAIDTSSLKGKKILLGIIDARVPILSQVARATSEAAGEVGIETSTFDAKSQFPRMAQAVQQAIDQKVDGFVSLGLPIEALPEPFEQLEAAGIPSVTVTTHQPDPDAPGQSGVATTANSAPDFTKAARLMASKAVVDTEGKANVAIIETKEIGISKTIVEGMRSVLDECSECKVQVTSVALADWATKVTPTAQSIIRRDPNVNYILTIFDDMAIFATAGVNQAGAADRVKVAGFNGTPAALKLIKDGDVFSADAGQPARWQGWHVLDQVMRGMLDEEPGNPVMPIRYFDDENLGDLDPDDEASLYGDPKFEEGFRELWGLQG
jgi:ribose transport system substrate-binding protein